MSKTKVSILYVDQTNGNDTNNGTKSAPFKSLQKAIDTMPTRGIGDIFILGDYVLTSDVNVSSKKISLILHGTLTSTEYSPRANYTGIYSIKVMNSVVYIDINSDNNGKIVVPAKSSLNEVDSQHYSIFNVVNHSNFADINFGLSVKQDDYNPIVINSGFGLVSVGEQESDNPFNNPLLNVEIIGHYPGKNRNIIVNSNSTLVSFKNTIAKDYYGTFYYDYDGGLTNEINTPIEVSSCVVGMYKRKLYS